MRTTSEQGHAWQRRPPYWFRRLKQVSHLLPLPYPRQSPSSTSADMTLPRPQHSLSRRWRIQPRFPTLDAMDPTHRALPRPPAPQATSARRLSFPATRGAQATASFVAKLQPTAPRQAPLHLATLRAPHLAPRSSTRLDAHHLPRRPSSPSDRPAQATISLAMTMVLCPSALALSRRRHVPLIAH